MRRWAVGVGGLAAAVLFGWVATHRVPVTAVDVPGPTPTEVAQPQLTGDPATAPAGLRVLVSGADPQLLDAVAGRAAPVRGLRLGPGERARLQVVAAGTVATVNGPTITRSTLFVAGGRAVPLGAGETVVPARTGTDLWVAGPGPGAAGSGGTTGTAGAARTAVRLVTRAGVVRRTWIAPGRLTPLRDTAAGLVVASSAADVGVTLLVVDPATGRERRLIAVNVLSVATGPASVAHVLAGCEGSCPVVVTPLGEGPDREYPVPPGTPGAGAFSPDGRWLALAVPGQYRNGRLSVAPGFTQVLDLRTGRVTPVPGVSTGAERVPDLSWYGDALVVAVWSADRGRLALWTPARPGPLAVLPLALPGDDRFSAAIAVP